jgi:ribosomal protein S27E
MSIVKDARREGTVKYERHKPEQTLLYQIIEKYYPQFLSHMGQQDKYLPKYVRSEFEAYLKCGRLEYGFLRVRCEDCHHEHPVAFSCKRRGFCPSCGARRMAESAALLVDDVLPHEHIRQWVLSFPFQLRFLFASYPHIMGKVLGIVYRTLATHITKKVGYNKQTARTKGLYLADHCTYGRAGLASGCAANVAGFSLHAGVMSSAQDRGKLERLCRYITRSGVSEKRLAITTYGKVRYQLKTPYRGGTTGDRRSHAIFEPLDFIARLAALVPKPRVNLTRFHGVFAPNSRHRVTITPALRNKTKQALPTGQEKKRAQKHQSMTWAQRLKRVFNIDIKTCEQCGGAVKVIASIEDPLVVQKILSHLNTKNDEVVELLPPQSRAPPQISLFE